MSNIFDNMLTRLALRRHGVNFLAIYGDPKPLFVGLEVNSRASTGPADQNLYILPGGSNERNSSGSSSSAESYEMFRSAITIELFNRYDVSMRRLTSTNGGSTKRIVVMSAEAASTISTVLGTSLVGDVSANNTIVNDVRRWLFEAAEELASAQEVDSRQIGQECDKTIWPSHPVTSSHSRE